MSTSTPNLVTTGVGSLQSTAGAPTGVARQVQDFTGRPDRLLIDGEWAEAAEHARNESPRVFLTV
jgi:hypothetical protein